MPQRREPQYTLADFDWMAAPGCEKTLRDVLTTLSRRVALAEIYPVLKTAKFAQRHDEQARRTRRMNRWPLAKRAQILSAVDTLEQRIAQVHEAAAAGRLLHLVRVLGQRRARHRASLAPGMRRVRTLLAQLRAAIENDPGLSEDVGQGRRGHFSQPWLEWAVGELRQRKVPKETAIELLRLIGLKPLEGQTPPE